MTDILHIIKSLPQVESAKEWRDRVYINLAAGRNKSFNGHATTKVWLKGDVLTVEFGRGYRSSNYNAELQGLEDAVKAAGGTVREI